MKYLLIAIAFITLNSCTKSLDFHSDNVQVSFDVEEQTNIARYVIETSVDQKVWVEKGAIKPDNSKLSTTYNLSLYQPGKGVVYLRVKSIDIDNSASYTTQWCKL